MMAFFGIPSQPKGVDMGTLLGPSTLLNMHLLRMQVDWMAEWAQTETAPLPPSEADEGRTNVSLSVSDSPVRRYCPLEG